MRNLGTRIWSTPLTIGAGMFVAITGLLMCFVTERPFKFAHELLSTGFAVAIVFHVLSHWRSFKRYFFRRSAVSVVVLAWSIGIGLVVTSAILNTGEAEEIIVARMDNTPIALLAPIVGMEVGELLDRLGDDGFAVRDPEMSVRQLADQHGAETDDVLLSVFR